jgi:ubiquinone/menaquinone biosynthesis C-methylase UbiE
LVSIHFKNFRYDLKVYFIGVPANCQFIQGDFMELPFEDNSFDHVYVIEAACHAPEKVFVD